MGSQASFRSGVLVIGSLLWDGDPVREQWRSDRLDEGMKQRVRARIRYGRLSIAGARANQYTMTFSTSVPAGRAYVLPCRKPIETFADLEAESIALARAEGLLAGGLWRDFGVLALVLHDANRLTSWRDEWTKFFGPRRHAARSIRAQYALFGEGPPLREDGILQIDWPLDAKTGKEIPFDILLAVANKPRSLPPNRRYATPEEIAATLVERAHQAAYFRDNVINGIRTAEDAAIWKAVVRRNPAWINGQGYAEVTARLREPL